ncbi:MAG: HlyC/CorC family transporter [Calditrichaeota bacterium]|nr:HlyC/CorC family transporter [Calditrichota bacterium]
MNQILLLIAMLLLSAFFSGSETAFVSVTLYETEIWLRKGRIGAKQAHRFIQRPEMLLVTILVGNNIAIVTFSSVVTYYFQGVLNDGVILLLNSFIILIFAEILPKAILREKAHSVVRFLAIPMLVFHYVMLPIIVVVNSFSKFLLLFFRVNPRQMHQFFNRRDMEILIREGAKSGVVEESEQEIITRIFRLSRLRVREIMVPRTDMVSIDLADDIPTIIQTVQAFRFSRYPVINKRVDNVVGLVLAKDLLKRPASVKEILREVYFVPESKLCIDLLHEFRQKKISLAVVVDEYGGTSGLVTLEDIIEELFGEIQDEYDFEPKLFKRVAPNTVIASARAGINDLNRELNWNLPAGNYETIGGLILERTHGIPPSGATLEVNGYRIQIMKATKKRILVLKLEAPQEKPE